MKKTIICAFLLCLSLSVSAQKVATDKLMNEISETYQSAANPMSLRDNTEFNAKIKEVIGRGDSSSAQLIAKYKDFVYAAGFIEEIKDCIGKFTPELLQSEDGKKAQDSYYRMHTPELGEKVPNFTLTTPDGKEVRLYEFLKGKKCVILDFWASWCGWCRKESPNIKNVLDTYKNKGFDVISVSFDTKREAWTKAIETDGTDWMQVSDLKGTKSFVYEWYGLSGIPAIFLIKSDGTMLAKGLRGEAILNAVKQNIE